MPNDEASFHPLALREISDAFDYYEARCPGLGDALDRQIQATVANVVTFPAAAPMWREQPELRVSRLSRFPYRLPYQVKPSFPLILALAHTSRRPGYWVSRRESVELASTSSP